MPSRAGTAIFLALAVFGPGAAATAVAQNSPVPVGPCKDGLVIAVPGQPILGNIQAGAVHFLHRNTQSLTTSGSQLIDQNLLGGNAGVWDRFGNAIASGDFDGDGCADLAVAAINENKPGASSAGEVNVIYGGLGGLLPASAQVFDQNMLGLWAEDGDYFGSVLATGDFNADGRDDLAIGVKWESIGDQDAAGGISIIYGGPNGLTTAGSQWFDQSTLGLSAEYGDYFGSALATGDFDGDGFDDLAASAEGEDLGPPLNVSNAGGVAVIFGSSAGLSAVDRQWFDQSTLGLSPEEDDWFGSALASGDFDGDRHDDLAVGAPYEGVAGVEDAGGVSVIYGSGTGLTIAGSQWIDQGVIGLDRGEGDRAGLKLAAGDLDGDGYDDLAMGAPYEAVGTTTNVGEAGEVDILYGGRSGLSVAGAQYFDQEVIGLAVETGDRYGWSLAIGDMDRDGYDDLAIGAAFEGVSGFSAAGGVNVLYGAAGKLSTLGQQWFDQSLANLSGDPGNSELFGYAVAAMESTLLFADGFENGNTNLWSGTVPP